MNICVFMIGRKPHGFFLFLQTLQLKLQNVVTQIQRNKICVLNKNVGIHLTLSYQTNSTSSQIRHS